MHRSAVIKMILYTYSWVFLPLKSSMVYLLLNFSIVKLGKLHWYHSIVCLVEPTATLFN